MDIIKYIYYLITINKIKYKKRVEVNAIAEKGKIIPELIHLKNLIFLFITLPIFKLDSLFER